MNAASAIDYEGIFLHAPMGMCMSENPSHRRSDEALAAMFGYARAQLERPSFEVLYHARRVPAHRDRIVPIMNAKGRYSDARASAVMGTSSGPRHGHAMLPRPLGPGIWTFEWRNVP